MISWRAWSAVALLGVTGLLGSGCGNNSTDASTPGPTSNGGAPSSPDAGLDADIVSPPDASSEGGSAVTPVPVCGNGQVEPGEDCDDGNRTAKDGCENNCAFTCTQDNYKALCTDRDACDGEEICSSDHLCKPAPSPAPDGTLCGTRSVCQSGKCVDALENCGDGIVVPPEECDPGTDGGTGPGCVQCRFVCTYLDPNRNCATTDLCAGKSVCNETTHACQAGTPLKDLTPCDPGKACVAGVCTDAYCSNNRLDPGEECDDGNLVKGDGCEPSCKFTCKSDDPSRDCHSDNECLVAGTCNDSTHQCSANVPKTAGTACGASGNDCILGNCVAHLCGDGVIATGVEACDDGNQVKGDGCEDDCKPSCTEATAATDCKGKIAACSVATCVNGVCGSAADPSDTGSCYYGGGTPGTCSNGHCGTCGDGKKDTYEFCDDGNLIRGDGCEPNCTFSCNTATDCDDKDPCNGKETCTSHKCAPGTAESDGAACGTGKVCHSGSCRPSYCGDGLLDAALGETCDPPNTAGCDAACHALEICDVSGDWALKITANVTWGDGENLEYGKDAILQWASLHMTQAGNKLSIVLRPCGLVIPDFKTTANLGGEWYGLDFPDAIWTAKDLPTFPIDGALGGIVPGSSVETAEAAILLGLTIATPPGPLLALWPDDPNDMTSAPFALVDQDDNQRLGISGFAKKGVRPEGSLGAGTPYADILANITAEPFARADELDLAIRQTATLFGQLDSCTTMSGAATPPPVIDNHIVGCHLDTGSECKSGWSQLPDSVRPRYVIATGADAGATFKATKVPDNPSCADVRAALP